MSYSSFKIKIGAPAAMLLAAAVTTAVSSSEPVRAAPQSCLTWTMNAGSPLAAQSARVFLAKEAANKIRALDRVSSTQRNHTTALENELNTGRNVAFEPCFTHTASSHQHAAP